MGDRKMLEDVEKFLTQIGLAALFASICGLAGYLHGQVKKHKPISWKEAAIRAFGSGVTGIILMMACQAAEFNPMWTGAIVGTCGWLGADAAVAMVRKLFKSVLQL